MHIHVDVAVYGDKERPLPYPALLNARGTSRCRPLVSSHYSTRCHEQVSFERGEIVEGTVIQFEPSGALIDIGAKATAYMPAREVTPIPSLHWTKSSLHACALGSSAGLLYTAATLVTFSRTSCGALYCDIC